MCGLFEAGSHYLHAGILLIFDGRILFFVIIGLAVHFWT